MKIAKSDGITHSRGKNKVIEKNTKVNKNFKVLNHKYSLSISESILESYGLCYFFEKKIIITQNKEIVNTLFHELTHAYLHEMGHNFIEDNEENKIHKEENINIIAKMLENMYYDGNISIKKEAKEILEIK